MFAPPAVLLAHTATSTLSAARAVIASSDQRVLASDASNQASVVVLAGVHGVDEDLRRLLAMTDSMSMALDKIPSIGCYFFKGE